MKNMWFLWGLAVLTGAVSSCSEPAAEKASCPENKACDAVSVEAYQLRLLDTAFEGVSMMPLKPHIKNRSRAQHKIVGACLELSRPEVAETYIKQIGNWQRWMGYADLACTYAEQGLPQKAQEALVPAVNALQTVDDIAAGEVLATAPTPLIDTLQGWRYNEVKARVYEAQYLLGAIPAGMELDTGEFDEGAISTLNTMSMEDRLGDYEAVMADLRLLADHSNFEVIQPVLLTMLKVADLHYDELEFAQWIEDEIIPHFETTPVFMRVDVLLHAAGVALSHGDTGLTLELCDQMDELIDAYLDRPRVVIPEKTKVIALRAEADDKTTADDQLNSLIALYNESEQKIVDIERAGLLCRLAETLDLLGRRDDALACYTRAISAGQINPNSRPRADDLNEICCSMALAGVEPTGEISGDLEEMKSGLGDPW